MRNEYVSREDCSEMRNDKLTNNKLTKRAFQVGGMHCASCVRAIERALKKVDGVSEANVNLATNKATIIYDQKKVKDEDLESAVSKVGYQAQLKEVKEEIRLEDEK